MSEKLLTTYELNDTIQFAKELWIAERYGMGLYTPDLSNQLLKSLNNNPRIPDFRKLVEVLSNYKENTENLQGYMEFMSHFDMLFERTLYSYVNALSFDLQIVCTNAVNQSDYESNDYIADKQKIYSFFDKFKYKSEFRKVVLSLMQNEVYYTWFRKIKWGNIGMKFALQILPQNRCLLTGYWENGLLFDFDMTYFLEAGVDINGYDPVFKKYYNNVFGEKANDGYMKYKPTNALNSRDGSYAMWVQTSPEDGAWAWKFDPSNFTIAPFLAPFLKNTLRDTEIEQLQYDKDMAAAYGILAGEIGLLDKSQSGNVPNQFAIHPDTLSVFMGKAKAGLDKIKLAALPLQNIGFYQYTDNNPNMYNDQLVTSAGVGSSISRVIYSSDKMSNMEIEAGLNEQYQTMKALYPQFENFLNYYANTLTKHYKFKFILDGSNYRFEREARFERLNKLAEKGIVLGPSSWASVMGYEPQDFERLLNEAKYSDFNTKWQLMLNTNTASSSVGRPQKDDSQLSESGEITREE